MVLYNVDTLVQYVLATGDFSEPQTRIPFTEEDLRRMDVEVQLYIHPLPQELLIIRRRCVQAKSAGLEERSVLEAKQNKHEFDEQKVKRDGILGVFSHGFCWRLANKAHLKAHHFCHVGCLIIQDWSAALGNTSRKCSRSWRATTRKKARWCSS